MKRHGIIALALIAITSTASFASPPAHLYRINLQGRGSAVPLAEAGVDVLAAIPANRLSPFAVTAR